jgi:hypothetical protein
MFHIQGGIELSYFLFLLATSKDMWRYRALPILVLKLSAIWALEFGNTI